MEDKAPEEHTVAREMLSSDSAARLSNEAMALAAERAKRTHHEQADAELPKQRY